MRTMHTIRRWPVTGVLACITFAVIAGFQWTATPPSATPAASPSPATASELLVRTPLGFEPDEGSDATFLARGPGQSVRLSPAGATWRLRAPAGKRDADASTRVHMRLVGANAGARGEGQQPQAGRSHYLRGADPKQWRLDVERFDKVRYAQVYPGVDLVYYGNQRDLEYDFVVAPGADPARIALAFDGVDDVSVDDAGNLVLATPHGRLVQHRPVVYQRQGAERRRIAGRYTVHDRRIAFEVGDYDRSRELVIDPVITYGTYLGGEDIDIGYGVAVDPQGNFYVAGTTRSLEFPTKSAADPSPSGDRSDSFVAKYNASGALVYATYLGGSSTDWLKGLAVDSTGHAYVVGFTDSPDFPVAKAIQSGPNSPGGRAVFVSRLSPGGNVLEFSTYLGGGADYGEAIAVDDAGHAYVTGLATYNFPTTPGVIDTTTDWGRDVFVSKIDTNAGSLLYSTYIDGGEYTDSYGHAIAVDAAGNAYVAGQVDGHNFPVVGGGFPEFDFYGSDIFLAKLAPDARSLLFSTYYGGVGTEWLAGLAIDKAGNAAIVGLTQATDNPAVAAAQPTYAGGYNDAFVAKFNTNRGGLVFSTYLGGSNEEHDENEMGIAMDAGGNVYVAGATFSTDFPVKSPIQATRVGTQTGFVTVYSPTGAMLASTYLGAEQYSYTRVTSIAVDKAANVYVTGVTDGDQLPVPGAAQPTLTDNYQDAFVIRIGAPPPRVRTDINGDGRDDVVWRNGTSGADTIWLGANSATPRAMNAVKDVAWEIVGIGDFGGDHVADVFWRNRSTGANVVWRSANYATQQATTAITDVNWRVAGVGDVDGDGKADVVWRNGRTGANALWRSASYATRVSLPAVTNLAWKIVGVADFNGDGKADLLWRNGTSGANVYWPAGDATKAISLTAVTNVDWEVVAVGDFSGDRKDDVLWRDRSNGNSVVWKSGNSASQQAVTAVRNLEWKVVGSGDYNGDATADILWRNTRTGDNVIWKSANSASQQAVARVADTAWKVAP